MLDAFAALRAAVRDLVSTVLATPPFSFLRVAADWLAARLPAPMPDLLDYAVNIYLTPTTPPGLRDDPDTARALAFAVGAKTHSPTQQQAIRDAAKTYGLTVRVRLPAPTDDAPGATYARDWPARVGVYPGGFANVEPSFPAGCTLLSVPFDWGTVARAVLSGRSLLA